MVTDASQPADSRDGVRRTLEVHGVRPTAQRIRMAEVMLAAPCHMTAEQVLAALRLSAARVSKATVYNTLRLFVERGSCGRSIWIRIDVYTIRRASRITISRISAGRNDRHPPRRARVCPHALAASPAPRSRAST
jgi:hypothetical protein